MIIHQLILTTSIIVTLVTILFAISVVIKRNDIADVAWGTGIFVVALINYFSGEQNALSLILTIMAGLWGLRLTTRIFLRNRKKSEDFRYKKWRDEWGKWFYLRSYFQVYLLQGLLMVVVGYSFIHANIFGDSLQIEGIVILGLIMWCVGYFFEVVGDYQLDKFIHNSNNKGKIMTIGLWRYSRHPNYFGEVTMWWGIWLMISVLPLSYVALISPIAITYLILKVSGIPMLEKAFQDNPDFQEYKKRTSAFFPNATKKQYMKKITVNDSMQSGYSYFLSEKMGQNFHPDFKPQLTPQEMLELGVFGGLYFGDRPSEFPKSWYKNAKLSPDGKQHKELNYFGVNASQSLSVWKTKGWIHKDDPRGWFQWYCRYYMGRRHDDDERQIKRWKAISRHIAQVVHNCRKGDEFCRPRQRQAILHWAYDSRKL